MESLESYPIIGYVKIKMTKRILITHNGSLLVEGSYSASNCEITQFPDNAQLSQTGALDHIHQWIASQQSAGLNPPDIYDMATASTGRTGIDLPTSYPITS